MNFKRYLKKVDLSVNFINKISKWSLNQALESLLFFFLEILSVLALEGVHHVAMHARGHDTEFAKPTALL